MEAKHKDITERIIKAFYTVYNTLGYGFLEKVYENALAIELRSEGLKIEQQARLTVYYANQLVGEYFADLLVNDQGHRRVKGHTVPGPGTRSAIVELSQGHAL